MKILSTNLKSVRQLTKYISPEEIEKIRYKKFNAPKIKAPNLLCDEFFRAGEVFDRKNDIIRPYQTYSPDDLRIYDRTSLYAIDRRRFEGSNAAYIESDLPYYVDIMGEKKRIYVEHYGTKSPKYPFEKDVDLSIHPFWQHNKNLYKDRSIDEIVNISYYADKLSADNSHEVKHIALSMMNKGFPLESVINIMKEAKLKVTDGDLPIQTDFMQFLSEYPNLRRYMITYSDNRSEVFDSNGAKIFTKLLDMCSGDTKEAYKILWDCRLEQKDGSFMTDLDFVRLAESLYRRGHDWNEEKSEVINCIKAKPAEKYPALIRRTHKYISLLMPLNRITEQLSHSSAK